MSRYPIIYLNIIYCIFFAAPRDISRSMLYSQFSWDEIALEVSTDSPEWATIMAFIASHHSPVTEAGCSLRWRGDPLHSRWKQNNVCNSEWDYMYNENGIIWKIQWEYFGEERDRWSIKVFVKKFNSPCLLPTVLFFTICTCIVIQMPSIVEGYYPVYI